MHDYSIVLLGCVLPTAISALIFERKFPILVARFISEQSRPSARPGPRKWLRLSIRPTRCPSDPASLNLCSMPGSLSLLHAFFFFACNEAVQNMFARVCSLLAEVCTAFLLQCMECVGNVCEAKEATDTRLFRRSSPQLTSHLHKSFFPGRSVCVALGVVQGRENRKYFCLSATAKRGISAMKRSPACFVRQWPEASDSVVDRAHVQRPVVGRLVL